MLRPNGEEYTMMDLPLYSSTFPNTVYVHYEKDLAEGDTVDC